MKRPEELSVVTLKRDLPEFRLRAGHVGTVVFVYEPDGIEVEFFDKDGDTHAILTLLDEDVKPATNADFKNPDKPDPWPADVEPPIADATERVKK